MRPVTLLILLLLLFATTASSAVITGPEQQPLLEYSREVMIARLQQLPPPPLPETAASREQRSCFVTFFVNGRVMACFGSFTPRYSTLAEEISDNIRLALIHDSRSAQLTPQMVRKGEIQITFPGLPQPINNWRMINPLHEGLLLERADGRGVAIVPGEARTASYAWRSALRRLGLNEQSDGVRLYRFKADWIRTK